MRVIVIFELAEKTLHKKLIDMGMPIGKNAFECEISRSELDKLKNFAAKLKLRPEEFVIIIPLCHSCLRNIQEYGSRVKLTVDDWMII